MTFTVRVVVDDGTEFSPAVELCVDDARSGRTRLVAVSGHLMSHGDIDEMTAMVIDELRDWVRKAKVKLNEAQAQGARHGGPRRTLAPHHAVLSRDAGA
jgi:hypothetical protein